MDKSEAPKMLAGVSNAICVIVVVLLNGNWSLKRGDRTEYFILRV